MISRERRKDKLLPLCLTLGIVNNKSSKRARFIMRGSSCAIRARAGYLDFLRSRDWNAPKQRKSHSYSSIYTCTSFTFYVYTLLRSRALGLRRSRQVYIKPSRYTSLCLFVVNLLFPISIMYTLWELSLLLYILCIIAKLGLTWRFRSTDPLSQNTNYQLIKRVYITGILYHKY